MEKKKFLTGHWKDLLMLNYEVDPAVLQKHLPLYTELDLWQGKALASVVGFMFTDTRVWGIKWPFHVNFEEVNLRFYVRYFDGEKWKRGAVFISEIVPKPIIAIMANMIYNEHYSFMPMRHNVTKIAGGLTNYTYEWKFNSKWNKLSATVNEHFADMEQGGAEQFIFEHYWGYNKLDNDRTLEYAVEHPSWQVAQVKDHLLEADIAGMYGEEFVPYLNREPYSVFFAKGSEVAVRVAGKITTAPIPAV